MFICTVLHEIRYILTAHLKLETNWQRVHSYCTVACSKIATNDDSLYCIVFVSDYSLEENPSPETFMPQIRSGK